MKAGMDVAEKSEILKYNFIHLGKYIFSPKNGSVNKNEIMLKRKIWCFFFFKQKNKSLTLMASVR